MFKLVPKWAYNYEEYWKSIKSRNIWFIQLRFGAVIMLLILYFIAQHVFGLTFSSNQNNWFTAISISIAFYNTILFLFSNKIKSTPGKFNVLHYSLLQMALDLVALTLLVYFTGSIETPIYMLYIFHMIIGSLILPIHVIFIMATLLVTIFSSIVTLEYFGNIIHYHISEIYVCENVHNAKFIIFSLGIFIFTIYTTIGITSRIAKKLYKREQQLKETLEELNNAEEAKQKYIMAVVHEIKSPIVAAQSIIELIINGYVGDVNDIMKRKLKRTVNRTDEALKLINNILRISKLKLLNDISYVKIDLMQILKLVLAQKSDLIISKHIELKVNDFRNEKREIDSDPVMIELVLSNIIGNAIKYTKDHQAVYIELAEDNKFVKINISDRGIGIPKNEIDKIFQQFYRATNLPSKYIEGSGLGLSLVKEIVERLNGSISILSPSKIGTNEYPGTSVIINFPIIQES